MITIVFITLITRRTRRWTLTRTWKWQCLRIKHISAYRRLRKRICFLLHSQASYIRMKTAKHGEPICRNGRIYEFLACYLRIASKEDCFIQALLLLSVQIPLVVVISRSWSLALPGFFNLFPVTLLCISFWVSFPPRWHFKGESQKQSRSCCFGLNKVSNNLVIYIRLCHEFSCINFHVQRVLPHQLIS